MKIKPFDSSNQLRTDMLYKTFKPWVVLGITLAALAGGPAAKANCIVFGPPIFLPPFNGHYLAQFHSTFVIIIGGVPVTIVITTVDHFGFGGPGIKIIPGFPALPGDPSHSFSSKVSGEVNGNPFLDPDVAVTVDLNVLDIVGATQTIQTEMTELDISGGELAPGLHAA